MYALHFDVRLGALFTTLAIAYAGASAQLRCSSARTVLQKSQEIHPLKTSTLYRLFALDWAILVDHSQNLVRPFADEIPGRCLAQLIGLVRCPHCFQ